MVYAARKSWSFDAAFWHKIDERFFGKVDGWVRNRWKSRLELLDESERKGLEPFVEKKLKHMKEKVSMLRTSRDEA